MQWVLGAQTGVFWLETPPGSSFLGWFQILILEFAAVDLFILSAQARETSLAPKQQLQSCLSVNVLPVQTPPGRGIRPNTYFWMNLRLN